MTSTGSKTFALPHDPLTPLDPTQPPTPNTVRLLCSELYANAQSVESTLGGGEHGHLGMLMPDYEYTLLAHQAIPYVHPDKPDVPLFAGTGANRDRQKEEHREAVDAYNDKRNLQNQLQKLMIQAIPKVYIATLAHRTLGFANVTPGELLNHLLITYGTIAPQDLEDNLAKIKTHWNPDTPIETVFANGEECRQLATDGQEPIPDGAYTRILVNIFRESGVMDKAIEDWELRRPNNQTLPEAIEHFTNADKYRRKSKAYLKDILSANAASTLPPPPAAGAHPPVPPNGSLNGWAYCWTHGVTQHTGTTCLYPAEGHVPHATLADRKGGSTTLRLGLTSGKERGGPGRDGRGRGRRGRTGGRHNKRKATGEPGPTT